MRCPPDVTIKDLHPKKQDPLHVKQEELEMPYIKQEEEPETPSITEGQDEIPKFPMIVSVKSEDDEGPSKESRAAKPASDSYFQHLTAKGGGQSQPEDVMVEDLHPEKHVPPNVKQEESEMPCIKQEAEPETPSVKEEQEDEIPKFPTTVSVKSEEDEGPSKESRAAKLASSSLFQHLPAKVSLWVMGRDGRLRTAQLSPVHLLDQDVKHHRRQVTPHELHDDLHVLLLSKVLVGLDLPGQTS
ncbi:zinc metalloprotease ZmpB-like [Corythoichthys intestinalis]|uniref:zinc metalloprotease ZmpB-like n=1 Tax=Corythoichthys intestinalis TaxID=161448 RepID=UPI0025A551E9|nr:zinc metalloprotease ZmpB-like [Corythoichthys intestinalis]